MTLALLLIVLSGFVAYFWWVWLWYIWLIPVGFLIFFVSLSTTAITDKIKFWKWWQQYLIFLAWIVILIWLIGSLHFFGLNSIDISQIMIVLNLVLWLGSYIVKYEDGKAVFKLWYYLSIIWLWILAYDMGWIMVFWKIFSMSWALHTAIIWFIVFIIWLWTEINRNIWYEFAIVVIWSIILIINHQIQDLYMALFMSSLLLSLIYYIIYKIIQNRPPSEQQQKTISVRRILAWERITQYQKPFKQQFHRKIYDMIIDMPRLIKYILEWLNIILIIVMISIYIYNIWKTVPTMHERLYWIIIASFVSNVILLKRINYTSTIQRLIVFAVINFAIYVSLFSIYDGNIAQITRSAVLWNIFCAISIFYLPKVHIGQYFKRIDYIFWLITTLLAMVFNISLFNRTQMPWQLLFSIIFLYVGIQWMTLFYATKHIGRMEE